MVGGISGSLSGPRFPGGGRERRFNNIKNSDRSKALLPKHADEARRAAANRVHPATAVRDGKRGQGSLGKEILGQHILHRPGASLRKLAKLKRTNGFVADRVTVGLAQDFPGMRAQRWAILDDALDPAPRLINRGFPRRAPPLRLVAPLLQMDEQVF
jgi:hypothetical protein